jgi:heme-degrading monooxygenase HmoA
MAAAPPFAAYSSLTAWTMPPDAWPDFYAALQALKGHVQEYPGCQRFDVFVHAEEAGVRVHCYTTWDTAAQLDAFVERGYTPARMAVDCVGVAADETLMMEKLF